MTRVWHALSPRAASSVMIGSGGVDMPGRYTLLEVSIPLEGLAFSVSAGPLYEPGKGWTHLRDLALFVIESIHEKSGVGLTTWFCPLESMEQATEESKDAMVAIVFTANDQPIDASMVDSIKAGLQRSSLSFVSHGMQSIPEMCFPALTWFEGHVCQVWLEDPEQPVSLFLDWDPRSQVVSTYGVTSPEELQEVFPSELGGVRFAFEEDPVGEVDALEQRRWERVELERLKIAFTWQFVYMVVQADGEFVAAERTFMQRLFPSSVLEATHLLDDQGQFIEPDFTNLKTRALAVLPDALSEEERVDLLKMLADAAWADDKLVPEEEAVFALAAEILQVPGDLCRSFFRR